LVYWRTRSTRGATWRRRKSFTRDAGAADQVNEAARIAGDEFQPAIGTGGRNKEYGVEIAGPHGVHVLAGFFDAGIDEEAAIDAGVFGGTGEAVDARSG